VVSVPPSSTSATRCGEHESGEYRAGRNIGARLWVAAALPSARRQDGRSSAEDRWERRGQDPQPFRAADRDGTAPMDTERTRHTAGSRSCAAACSAARARSSSAAAPRPDRPPEVQIFKPSSTRATPTTNRLAQRDAHPSRNVSSSAELLNVIDDDTEVVGIDEGQFFDAELPAVCNTLANRGKRVIVAGLDQDYSEAFEPMPQLLAIAEYITKTLAICMVCGNRRITPTLVVSSDRLLLGAQGTYEPVRRCFDPALSSARGPSIGPPEAEWTTRSALSCSSSCRVPGANLVTAYAASRTGGGARRHRRVRMPPTRYAALPVVISVALGFLIVYKLAVLEWPVSRLFARR